MKELDRLVPVYMDWWNRKGVAGLPFLIEGKVSSVVLLIQYKKFPALETLPPKEMTDLMQFAQELYPEGDDEILLKAAKITYTIGTLL